MLGSCTEIGAALRSPSGPLPFRDGSAGLWSAFALTVPSRKWLSSLRWVSTPTSGLGRCSSCRSEMWSYPPITEWSPFVAASQAYDLTLMSPLLSMILPSSGYGNCVTWPVRWLQAISSGTAALLPSGSFSMKQFISFSWTTSTLPRTVSGVAEQRTAFRFLKASRAYYSVAGGGLYPLPGSTSKQARQNFLNYSCPGDPSP